MTVTQTQIPLFLSKSNYKDILMGGSTFLFINIPPFPKIVYQLWMAPIREVFKSFFLELAVLKIVDLNEIFGLIEIIVFKVPVRNNGTH